jgi:prophage regulatory protein
MDTRKLNVIGADDDDVSALLLRIGMVVRVTGLGRSTIYRLVAQDQFPPPVRLTKRVVAWRRIDLERWTSAREAVVH